MRVLAETPAGIKSHHTIELGEARLPFGLVSRTISEKRTGGPNTATERKGKAMNDKDAQEALIMLLGGPLMWLFLLVYGLYIQAFDQLFGGH